jgi:hypothetical protein
MVPPQLKAKGLETSGKLPVKISVKRLKDLASDVHRWNNSQKGPCSRRVW